MAARKEPKFLGIDHVKSPETDHDSAFESLLQIALLLALKEFGLIHDLEFQQADKLVRLNNGGD